MSKTRSKKTGSGTAAMALAAALLAAPALRANDITVDEISPGLGAVIVDGSDGLCSLREAVDNANDTTGTPPHGDCAAGDDAGADTILLPAGAVFTLMDFAVSDMTFGRTGLPPITSAVTLQANGSTIRSGQTCTLDLTGAASEFRLLLVAPGGDLTVEEARLENGCADGRGSGEGFGGGVFNQGTLTLRRSALAGNQALFGGGLSNVGAIVNGSAVPAVSLIESSTFEGNSASFGGGIDAETAFVTLRNSTLSGNSALSTGGGLNVAGATVTLEQATFAANTAKNGGGGIFNQIGTVNAKNVILNASGCGVPVGGSWNAAGSNLDSGTSCAALFGSNFTSNASISLAPLADNGGPTRTHALGAGSAAIDGATDCTAFDMSAITVDQRGVARPQGTECDIGAFESEPVDYGDAPDPLVATSGAYPTLLANDGARHRLSAGLFLGACADAEAEGQPSMDASGDDANAGSPVAGSCGAGGDEDGAAFTSPLLAGAMASVDVTASAAGLLDAWADFNADGDWADPGEQIFAGESLTAGVNALSFAVPAGASLGGTFARFRLSTSGGLDPDGFAADGEVEDYAVTIEPPIQISIDDVSLAEGDAGSTPFQFSVSVSSTAVAVSVTVHRRRQRLCRAGLQRHRPPGVELPAGGRPDRQPLDGGPGGRHRLFGRPAGRRPAAGPAGTVAAGSGPSWPGSAQAGPLNAGPGQLNPTRPRSVRVGRASSLSSGSGFRISPEDSLEGRPTRTRRKNRPVSSSMPTPATRRSGINVLWLSPGKTGFQPVFRVGNHQRSYSLWRRSMDDVFRPFDDVYGNASKRQRKLPHWEDPGLTYFATFRLADSLPAWKLRALKEERRIWLEQRPQPWSPADRREYERRFDGKVLRWLDQGHGSCLLRVPAAAALVEAALHHFDGRRYVLDEFAVMPNHVHVLVLPLRGYSLGRTLHSWKSYTSNRINTTLGREGRLWMDESFDHAVRTWEKLERFREYIRNNPSKANLRPGEYILGCGKGIKRGPSPG